MVPFARTVRRLFGNRPAVSPDRRPLGTRPEPDQGRTPVPGLHLPPGSEPSPGSTVAEVTSPFDEGATYARYSLALIRRPSEVPYRGDRVLEGPSAIVPFLHRLLEAEPSECFGAVFLSARNHPIGHTIPFRGTIAGCRVEPRQLLIVALQVNAAALLAFHQHPSGDPTPSAEDLAFAERLRKAGDVVGVALRDFIVLGEPPRYSSLREGEPPRRCWPFGPVVPAEARPRTRRRRRPKYRDPEDPGRTWVGTGHMPVWLREEIEAGATLDDYLVPGAVKTDWAAKQEAKVLGRKLGVD